MHTLCYFLCVFSCTGTDGIGNVSGSLLSGFLTKHVPIAVIALIAAGLCFFAVSINVFVLSSRTSGVAEGSSKSSSLDIGKAIKLLQCKPLRRFMGLQTLVGVFPVCVRTDCPLCTFVYATLNMFVYIPLGS